ncbi:MAG: phenylalanine--tRNA ligase subunit alpha [Phycisphaeraceae bacterium]|nr:phenylalanine--tRNA ligase subunit alpha [Phycisphaeraceae bacterium]MCW5755109.1 phenylalanine--tRNA ligase subunit alpha [Phycisphaeraceae bacterium]
MLDTLEDIRLRGLAQLEEAADPAALESWRLAYLGPKGRLKAALAEFQALPKDQKAQLGQQMNQVRTTLETAFNARKLALSAAGTPDAGPRIDVTEPGLLSAQALGRTHIISRVRDELVDVFARLGFSVAEGPELEDDEHNFVKLNIPPSHPARDPIDNFYVDPPDRVSAPRMLRSQTSTVQIRVMEDAVAQGWGPPIRIISPGRVYRPDTVDATHSFMFHQLEGLAIDRDITLADLKTTLLQFARAYFGPDAEIRLRPSFFPFTEPSAELDMKIALKPGEPPRWIELGGCGMVDPAVLEACGIDPEQWTGFAFGFGIERIAMGRYGIPDIRLLFENDIRFLNQI